MKSTRYVRTQPEEKLEFAEQIVFNLWVVATSRNRRQTQSERERDAEARTGVDQVYLKAVHLHTEYTLTREGYNAGFYAFA